MFKYIKSGMDIKDRADLESANLVAHEAETLTSDAAAELGGLSAGNMDAIAELGGLVAGNMDALVEIGGLIEQLTERISALEAK